MVKNIIIINVKLNLVIDYCYENLRKNKHQQQIRISNETVIIKNPNDACICSHGAALTGTTVESGRPRQGFEDTDIHSLAEGIAV